LMQYTEQVLVQHFVKEFPRPLRVLASSCRDK
jgi:hypothetical protein